MSEKKANKREFFIYERRDRTFRTTDYEGGSYLRNESYLIYVPLKEALEAINLAEILKPHQSKPATNPTYPILKKLKKVEGK